MDLSPEEFHPLVELAAERTSDGVLCVDTEGKILFSNESASRTLGEPAESLCGKIFFAIAPEMNPALWRELWKEIRSHSPFTFEFALTAGIRQIQVDISIHHLALKKRELACIFFRDIEERKRLQNLQQEFVGTASHELRTPMTVIREGVSQVLEGLRGDVNDSQRRALTLALTGIDRLGRILDDILDISKIESGKVSLRPERLDLTALAREVGATFQGLAADRKLDLQVTTPAGPVMVYADRDRLTQVLTNLISNSFKFTEKGHIQMTIAVKEKEAECSVSDSGIGLAAEDAEKIFNKFEQLNQTAVTGEKGTGLGLSISRGIVELHRGRIWAQSEGPGKGARLAFAIPKQTGGEVFRDQLEPMLRDVSRRGGNLSTVIFHLENRGAISASETELSGALSSIEQLIRQHSGRMTDVIVKDKDALYLALQSMVKREGLRIAERISAAFQDHLKREKLADKLRLNFTLTGFPEDQGVAEEYLDNIYPREAA